MPTAAPLADEVVRVLVSCASSLNRLSGGGWLSDSRFSLFTSGVTAGPACNQRQQYGTSITFIFLHFYIIG